MTTLLLFALCLLCSSRQLSPSMRLNSERDMIPKACPCADPELCKPVTVTHKKEIFGFAGDDWKYYPFDLITTIAWDVSDPQLICKAHASKTRLIAGAPSGMPLTNNQTARAEYIQNAIQMVKNNYLDGITFDFEGPLKYDAPEVHYYTQIVTEATVAFHSQIPGSQVSVCVGWSPDDIDGRAYDYPALARGSDLLYVMSYDTRSWIFGRCLASANTPFSTSTYGIQRYLDIGVSKDKLVLGLPWYGYIYPCLPPMGPKDTYCSIPLIPWRGVNCSDAAGTEYSYAHIMSILDSGSSTTGLMWDDSVMCPYFNYQQGGTIYQVWFDNPRSLGYKYQMAKSFGLRGTGPYTFNDLDATGQKTKNPLAPKEAKEMWDALREFL